MPRGKSNEYLDLRPALACLLFGCRATMERRLPTQSERSTLRKRLTSHA